MTNMFLVRGFMPMAMVALALSACGTKPDTDGTTDGTDTDDTTATTETGDSGATNDGPFTPATASISFDLAYNADHQLSTYFVDGNEVPPTMNVTYTDASGNNCTNYYAIDIDAFNTYVGAGDAAATDFADWLDSKGLLAGTVIADGLFSAIGPVDDNGADCVLADGYDHSALLGGVWLAGWTDSVPDEVQTTLDENGGIAGVYGADFDEANAMGGFVRLPDGFFGAGSPREFGAYGLAGEVDAATMEVQVDASGNLVPIAAADLRTADGPAPSYVRLFPTFGIQFN